MQYYSEIHFKWVGKKAPCLDVSLMNKNYEFYSECEIDNIKYEVGAGAIVRIESKPHVAIIHYFYEIPHSLPKVKKYVAALELFYKAKDIENNLAKYIKLDSDLEVVKKDNVILVHVPVYAIKSRCVVVYGLQDEDPQDLHHEFMATTTYTIYVCRYIASLKYGIYSLQGAVYNEDEKNKSNGNLVIASDEEQSPSKHLTAGKYSVSHVENIATNIKITIKRDLTPETQKFVIQKQKKHVPHILVKKTQESPSELMKSLILSPKQQIELPSLVQELVLTSSGEDRTTIDEIRQPVVVLNKIEMNTIIPSVKKSARIEARRSSRVKTIDSETNACITPTRSSKRQIAKISYTAFYDTASISEKRFISTRSSKTFDDYSVSSTRSSGKQNLTEALGTATVTYEDPSNKTEEKQNTVKDTSSRTRKNSATEEKQKSVEDTPRKTRKQSVSFVDTPRKNKKHELDETVVRPKRSVTSSVDVTPKKQSRIMTTPKSGRPNIMTMTPSIEEREEPIVFCNTPMSRARMGLSAYSVPSKMPCRENEYMNIYSFVTGRLMDQSSGCMYISGVPGTGKTMTVCRVMSDLSDKKQDYSDFVFLKLNALALTEPRQIYVEIVKKLLNKKMHWEESLKEIERFFKAKKKKIAHVILVDELDKLCNRKQDVVYNLLDLPFHSVTPLIVITIANTMDLPERILTNKVNSRLGLVRLTFKPYQYKDLVKIVTERLATDAVFKNEALELVSRKVAAVSGDARRALAMCARATEIAEEEGKDLVTMDVVDRVIKEMSSSSKVQAIQCCSKLEQLVLSAIANEVTRTGNEEVPFLNMLHNLEQLCLLESFKLPSAEVCLKSCHNLGSFRLLITQHGRTDINMTLMLNISTDDVYYALRN